MSSATTCPWAHPEVLLAQQEAKGIHLRKAAAPPWGNDATPAPSPSKKHLQSTTKETCPWTGQTADRDTATFEKSSQRRQRSSSTANSESSNSVPDAHTVAFERAARRREKPPPSPAPGSAGAGGIHRRDKNTEQIRYFPKEDKGSPFHTPQSSALAAPAPPGSSEEADEQKLVLKRCLAYGLSEQEIASVLEEHAIQKAMQRKEQAASLSSNFSPSSPAGQIPSPPFSEDRAGKRHYPNAATPNGSNSYGIGTHEPSAANGHLSSTPSQSGGYPEWSHAAGAPSASMLCSLDPQRPGPRRREPQQAGPAPGIFNTGYPSPDPQQFYSSNSVNRKSPDERQADTGAGPPSAHLQEGFRDPGLSEAENVERTALIKHCMSQGLSDNDIVDVLAQYRYEQPQKQMQQTVSMSPPRTPQIPPRTPQIPLWGLDTQQQTPPSAKQACLTPSSSVVSLASKRTQQREVSIASCGYYDAQGSRQAFMDNRSMAAATRNKMRNSSGIF